MFESRLNALRIRIAFMAVGLMLTLVMMAASGRLGGRPHGTIAIEWGAYPKSFAGLAVAVDGHVVGRLGYIGAHAVSGFDVPVGTHEVSVSGPQWKSVPRTVEVRADHTVRFILDASEVAGADGQATQALVLN